MILPFHASPRRFFPPGQSSGSSSSSSVVVQDDDDNPCLPRQFRRLIIGRPLYLATVLALLALSVTLIILTRNVILQSQKQTRLERYGLELKDVSQHLNNLNIKIDSVNLNIADINQYLEGSQTHSNLNSVIRNDPAHY